MHDLVSTVQVCIPKASDISKRRGPGLLEDLEYSVSEQPSMPHQHDTRSALNFIAKLKRKDILHTL